MNRRILSVVLAAVAIALCVMSSSLYLVLSRRLEEGADAALASRADAVVATLAVQGGRMVSLDTQQDDILDAGVWVFGSDGRPVVSSPVNARRLARIADAAAGSPGVSDLDGATHILVRPVTLEGLTGTIVVATARGPYEQAERDALVGMIGLGALLLAASGVGCWWVIRTALAPVRQMTDQARDWSERRQPGHRFHRAPARDEIGRLAATFDLLLGRVDAALMRERRLTAEIAHELRTPVARIHAAVDLALRRPRTMPELLGTLEGIRADLGITAEAMDAILAAAREQPNPLDDSCDPRGVAESAVSVARRDPGGERLRWQVTVSPIVARVRCDATTLSRILAPLLDNAQRYAVSEVAIGIARSGDEVVIAVVDDGPGFDGASLERQPIAGGPPVIDPDGVPARGSGVGLGLALARRLASAAGGGLELVAGPGGHVRVLMPVGELATP
jgi:signal transduction histidine kinase